MFKHKKPFFELLSDEIVARADDQIRVTLVGEPGMSARFSIAGVFNALELPLIEDPEEPGAYSGVYKVQWGDNIEDAAVTVILTINDQTTCQEAEQKVSIDTIPPRIKDAKASRKVVRNGQILQLEAVSEPGCCVTADVAELDTTHETVLLKEKPEKPGFYQRRIRISSKNEASNGHKRIEIIATDLAGNESEPSIVRVELRNSELHNIRGLSDDVSVKLNKIGVVTLADLRRIDVEKIVQETGLSSQELELHRAAAKLQAIGIDASVAYVLVHLGNILGLAQLALTPPEMIHEIIQTGVQEDIIPRELFAYPNFVNQLIERARKIRIVCARPKKKSEKKCLHLPSD